MIVLQHNHKPIIIQLPISHKTNDNSHCWDMRFCKGCHFLDQIHCLRASYEDSEWFYKFYLTNREGDVNKLKEKEVIIALLDCDLRPGPLLRWDLASKKRYTTYIHSWLCY